MLNAKVENSKCSRDQGKLKHQLYKKHCIDHANEDNNGQIPCNIKSGLETALM